MDAVLVSCRLHSVGYLVSKASIHGNIKLFPMYLSYEYRTRFVPSISSDISVCFHAPSTERNASICQVPGTWYQISYRCTFFGCSDTVVVHVCPRSPSVSFLLFLERPGGAREGQRGQDVAGVQASAPSFPEGRAGRRCQGQGPGAYAPLYTQAPPACGDVPCTRANPRPNPENNTIGMIPDKYSQISQLL